jgi:hypothetical protein
MTWALNNVNLAGVSVGGGDYKPLPKGAYKVKITETKEYTKESTGAKSIMFQLVVAEGESKGSECRIYIGLDLSKKGILMGWKSALISIGNAPEAVDRNGLNFGEKTFLGKDAYIFVTPKEETKEQKGDDVRFISKDRFIAETKSASNGSAGVPQPNGANLDSMLGGVSL